MGQSREVDQPGISDRAPAEVQSVESADTDAGHHRVDPIEDAGLKDVGEIVNTDVIDQPSGPPKFPTRIGEAVTPLPIVVDAPPGSLNRLHRNALEVDVVKDPAEPGADK